MVEEGGGSNAVGKTTCCLFLLVFNLLCGGGGEGSKEVGKLCGGRMGEVMQLGKPHVVFFS